MLRAVPDGVLAGGVVMANYNDGHSVFDSVDDVLAQLHTDLATAQAEIARLTDPAMKCRECPFNLTAELATRDELIRELVAALEPFVKDFKYEELDYGSYCSHCGSVDDVMEYSYHKKTCPLRIADQALARARDLLKGQGEKEVGDAAL